jgi:hypothetical protein
VELMSDGTLLRPPAIKPLVTNGKMNACQLSPVYCPGNGHLSMYPAAAIAWGAMVAVLASVHPSAVLSATGIYRTYATQLATFLKRYTTTYTDSECYGRNDSRNRTWDGVRLRGFQRVEALPVRWYLKRGNSPCAVPGTSNHGYGIAVDMAWFAPPAGTLYAIPGSSLKGIESHPAGWAWLRQEALSFGFGWEGALPGKPGWEPWHVRHLHGDGLTQRVRDVQAFFAAASAAA